MRRTIGQLAKAAGINPETVRYYERRGLIEQPSKPAGGFRHYPESTLQRLYFIQRAKQLGFSLAEIKTLLELSGQHCNEIAQLAERKLTKIKKSLDDLLRLQTALTVLVEQCRELPDRTAYCPIIEALQPNTKNLTP